MEAAAATEAAKGAAKAAATKLQDAAHDRNRLLAQLRSRFVSEMQCVPHTGPELKHCEAQMNILLLLLCLIPRLKTSKIKLIGECIIRITQQQVTPIGLIHTSRITLHVLPSISRFISCTGFSRPFPYTGRRWMPRNYQRCNKEQKPWKRRPLHTKKPPPVSASGSNQLAASWILPRQHFQAANRYTIAEFDFLRGYRLFRRPTPTVNGKQIVVNQ